jgi:hypothetical protein
MVDRALIERMKEIARRHIAERLDQIRAMLGA